MNIKRLKNNQCVSDNVNMRIVAAQQHFNVELSKKDKDCRVRKALCAKADKELLYELLKDKDPRVREQAAYFIKFRGLENEN